MYRFYINSNNVICTEENSAVRFTLSRTLSKDLVYDAATWNEDGWSADPIKVLVSGTSKEDIVQAWQDLEERLLEQTLKSLDDGDEDCRGCEEGFMECVKW